jgi:hypothetical protein
MAEPTLAIIDTLRSTANALAASGDYQWGHMGACNCGFLVQQITQLGKAHIHRTAMQQRGDWSEQLNDYCPASGLEMDNLITMLVSAGFTIADLRHLERLSDPDVLRTVPANRKTLRHNIRTDVLVYLRLWANLLETRLIANINLPDLSISPVDSETIYNP